MKHFLICLGGYVRYLEKVVPTNAFLFSFLIFLFSTACSAETVWSPWKHVGAGASAEWRWRYSNGCEVQFRDSTKHSLYVEMYYTWQGPDESAQYSQVDVSPGKMPSINFSDDLGIDVTCSKVLDVVQMPPHPALTSWAPDNESVCDEKTKGLLPGGAGECYFTAPSPWTSVDGSPSVVFSFSRIDLLSGPRIDQSDKPLTHRPQWEISHRCTATSKVANDPSPDEMIQLSNRPGSFSFQGWDGTSHTGMAGFNVFCIGGKGNCASSGTPPQYVVLNGGDNGSGLDLALVDCRKIDLIAKESRTLQCRDCDQKCYVPGTEPECPQIRHGVIH